MEKGRFFNAVDNDRLYNADDINAIIAAIATTGINGDGFTVTPLSGLTVTIAPGEAVIEGHLYTLDEPKNLTCDAAHATNPRIDAVVIRLDNDARTITSQIVKGTPAASPVAPSPMRTGTIYDLVVAHIYIPASAASITAGNITDTRADSVLCGNITLIPHTKVSKAMIEAELTGNITSHEHTRYLDKGEGVQALRFNDGALEVYTGSYWAKIDTYNGSGVPPLDVGNLSISEDYGKLTIKWRDPDDLVLNGTVVSKWAGTKLVRKAGSYPKNPSDGVILLDSTVKDAYAENGFVDSGITAGETYYYQLFPYSNTGAVNLNETNRISGTVWAYKIYGVQIDLTNPNPETACVYTDDAVGMTPGTAWDDIPLFKRIRPCVFKNGIVQYYLDPNDLTKKIDGTDADITSGNDGDVMVEIPKIGYLIETTGNILIVKITDNPNNPNFKYYAHTRETEGDRDYLYVGAYLGYVSDSKLRSLSGKEPTGSQTLDTMRTYAKANGAGYDLLFFYPLTLLQCLYLIKYKNRDSQSALGRGYAEHTNRGITGQTNTKGIDFGESTGHLKMCFLNIEDLWGCLETYIDGVRLNLSREIQTSYNGSNYISRGIAASSDISGYMSKPHGTSEIGFIAAECSGSATTHFADYASSTSNRSAIFGGFWGEGDKCGMFSLKINYYSSNAYTFYGARLMYL